MFKLRGGERRQGRRKRAKEREGKGKDVKGGGGARVMEDWRWRRESERKERKGGKREKIQQRSIGLLIMLFITHHTFILRSN